MPATKEELRDLPNVQILQQTVSNFPLSKLKTVGELLAMLRLLERLSLPMELDLRALEKALESDRAR